MKEFMREIGWPLIGGAILAMMAIHFTPVSVQRAQACTPQPQSIDCKDTK